MLLLLHKKIPLVGYTREDFNVGTLFKRHIFILFTKAAAISTLDSSYHFVLGLSLLLYSSCYETDLICLNNIH